jgi:hypothetical protein
MLEGSRCFFGLFLFGSSYSVIFENHEDAENNIIRPWEGYLFED